MTEPQHIKLSEVAHTTGIPADTLKLMVADDLLTGAVRGRGGHIYFRQGQTPTWSDCIEALPGLGGHGVAPPDARLSAHRVHP